MTSVTIPLDTEAGRIAARRYAELTNDQLLMDQVDKLDKEAHDADRQPKR